MPPWQALIEPAAVFASLSEVLDASHLSREQKRAILASWASDAFAVESAPALRRCPDGGQMVRLDDVLAALRSLDDDPPIGSAPRQQQPQRPWPVGRGRPGGVRWLKLRRRAELN